MAEWVSQPTLFFICFSNYYYNLDVKEKNMGKFDRTCVVCGKHYEYCTNCDRFLNYPTFMTMYCSKECVDLFDVLSSFEAGQTSKEDAQKVLQGMDQNKMKMLKNSMANSYKKIMAEEAKPVKAEEKKSEPVKPEIEKQIAGETVKKAVYNATRESGKNVPRSIVSRKH